MAVLAGILGAPVAGLGLLGVLSPSWLLALIRRWQSQVGLYVSALIRLVLGLALLPSAPDSRAPELLRVLGTILVISGIATPLIGLSRFEELLRRWSEGDSAFFRAYSALLLALGGSTLWALVP